VDVHAAREAAVIKKPALWIAFGAFLLAIPVAVSLRARAQEKMLPRLGQVPSFSLVDQEGKPFQSAALLGRVWVANFIYTSCSTMCPKLSSTMADLARHLRNRGQERNVHLVSFTIDPERDTVARLKGYATGFGADPSVWTFATGSSDAIRDAVVKGFHIGVDKEKSDVEADGFALVHGKSFILVDARGFIRGIYDAGDPGDMGRLRTDLLGLVEKGGS
jgi:protein SCO1/2